MPRRSHYCRGYWLVHARFLVSQVAPGGWAVRRLGALASPVKWEPLTPEGAARARLAVGRLSSKNGPVYIDVAAGDLAAYAFDVALRGMTHDSAGAEALARDDHLYLRANVDYKGNPVDAKSLGPLNSMLSGKQEITVRGRLEVLSPGHAQFRVDEIALKDLKLPAPIIESIVARIDTKDRDAKTAKDAIPVRVPPELADVRVTHGHVVLYKTVP